MGYDITNPVWVRAGMIDVTWNHPRLGIIPYSCVDGSGEEEMQAIWDATIRGDFGPIAGEP
jgi:hypothetical protein